MALNIRRAERNDLHALIRLLQQLSLDVPREELNETIEVAYKRAFELIERDMRQTLLVAADDDKVVGTAVAIVIPSLSHVGTPYCVVEDVVVDATRRGQRIGEALMARAVEIAREAGCHKVMLTSNKARTDAHRFYERIGFKPVGEGFLFNL